MVKQRLILGIALLLGAVGLFSMIAKDGFWSPQGLAIPVILIAVVFLLYKFPPRRFAARSGRGTPKVKPSRKTQAKVSGMRKSQSSPAKSRKQYPFQVIEGSKGKTDDEQLPKYH